MVKREWENDEAGLGARLDSVDRHILQLLVEDARRSTRAIAREVGMSPGAISERVARLEREGIITGYHAALDISALGYPIVALIGLEVEHGREPFSGMIDQLLAVPSVRQVQVVTGEWDLLLEVVVRDHDELREVLLEQIWSIPGFRHSQTMMLLEVRGRPGAGGWAIHELNRSARPAERGADTDDP